MSDKEISFIVLNELTQNPSNNRAMSPLMATRITNKINTQTKETTMTEEEIKEVARLVTENIIQDPIFVGNLMFDLTSRIDYMHIIRELSERLATKDLVEQLMDIEEVSGRKFANRIIDSDRFRSVLSFACAEQANNVIRGTEMQDKIDYTIDHRATNMSNEIVDRVLKLISKRIKEASDV
jgi:hypothetical protein